MTELQRFVDELPGSARVPTLGSGGRARRILRVVWLAGTAAAKERRAAPGFQRAHDDLHVVLAEAIQSQAFACGIHPAVCAEFGVAVLRRPLGNIRVKAFAVFHDRGQ